jgi:hypothetical protein
LQFRIEDGQTKLSLGPKGIGCEATNSGKRHGQMDDARLLTWSWSESEFAEHLQHGGVLWQDLRDQPVQSCVARQVRQMAHESRSDTLPLIRVDHDEGDFGAASLDNDVASTSDYRRPPIFTDLCDERDMIVEIDIHEESEFGF